MDQVTPPDNQVHYTRLISLGNILTLVVMFATFIGLYAAWSAQIAKVPALDIAVTANTVRVAKIEQHQADVERETADHYKEILDRLSYIQSVLDRKQDKAGQ